MTSLMMLSEEETTALLIGTGEICVGVLSAHAAASIEPKTTTAIRRLM
jgi:hypothetical protein